MEPDQCTVCLDALTPSVAPAAPEEVEAQLPIALLPTCGHYLHDECLREWTQKTNSCPICRTVFHKVNVLDKVGGQVLSQYEVQDKKQVIEFDPAWILPTIEVEDLPCPICGSADSEDQLMLCNTCDAPYHTYCVGLERVPITSWHCMECAPFVPAANVPAATSSQSSTWRIQNANGFTVARTRQVQRQFGSGRADHWMSPWSQIGGQIYNDTAFDVENPSNDPLMRQFRDYQAIQLRNNSTWAQQVDQASRRGARQDFQDRLRPRRRQRPQAPTPPPPPPETREETDAWRHFDKATEIASGSRKRKRSKSSTASPVERPAGEPERKRKRPAPRRHIPRPEDKGEASSDGATDHPPAISPIAGPSRQPRPMPRTSDAPPSFLSALLQEVETGRTTDSGATSAASPSAASPSAEMSSRDSPASSSNYTTPRALSMTPPPPAKQASSSPLSASSSTAYRQDFSTQYSPQYSPNRSSSLRANSPANAGPTNAAPERRHPRPQRKPQHNSLPKSRSTDTSPSRSSMPIKAKERISTIVKKALEPHWKCYKSVITKDQYAQINRSVSHHLYDTIDDPMDESNLSKFEDMAAIEVGKMVKAIQTGKSS